MNKKITVLLALTFLFLFSGSVYGFNLQDSVEAIHSMNYEEAFKLLLPLAWEDTAADKFELVFLSLLLICLVYFIVNTIGRIVLEQPKNSNIKKVLRAISELFITAILLVTATIAINASILLIPATISVYGDESNIKKEYWDNGKLRSETHYKKGLRHGLETTWYESGEKESEYNHNNNNLEGLATSWYKTGVKQNEQQWKDDKLWLVTEWDEDGKQTLQYDNEGSMGE